MIKTIIFDTDGVLIKREMYFSQRLSQDFGIPPEKILPFFKNEFQQCLVGAADLKVELAKYLKAWNWEKSIDELLAFWFTSESNVDSNILGSIKSLRSRGFLCYAATNNEKYRVQYLYDKLGFNNIFDGVFSSAELGCMKPKPEFWLAIDHKLGQPGKSEVLVWDDEQKNVESARNFGFQAELYTDFGSYQRRMMTLVG